MEATVSLSGYVGGDVVLTQTRNGDAKAKFRLAVTPRAQRNGVWSDLETTWYAVDCFRGLAENVKESVGRGDPVVVAGKLRTRMWIDEENVERSRLTVEAFTVGHDLTRGTTTYHRSVKPRTNEDPFDEATDDDGGPVPEDSSAVESEGADETLAAAG